MKLTLPGQMDLPECPERLGQALQAKADARLVPAKPQLPCDVGLFSDEAAQSDLVDQCRNQERRDRAYANKLARSKSARWAAK